jgi:tuftelin-interacting protein 11
MARTMNSFASDSSSESSDEDQDDFLHPSTDPTADEFDDYNPRKRRRTGRDPKESAALGIFGSESEDERLGGRCKSKNMRAKSMAFVKPGQNKRNSSENDEDEDEKDEAAVLPEEEHDGQDIDMDGEGEEDIEEPSVPRMGLGAQSTSRQGKVAFGGMWQSPSTQGVALGTTSASPFGRGFVPSSANIPILKEADGERPPQLAASPSAFLTPTASKNGRGGANSQKATIINPNSFAARMMAKMGYKEGQGLGKDSQGRSGVIDVQLRPQRIGLGAVKEKTKQERDEERRQAALRGEILEDSEEEKKRRHYKPKTSGTDSGTSTPKRRQKPKYQSLPELQRAAPGLHIPEAFTPILDMTGPGQRLLTSTSGLLTPTTGTESTEMVEAKKLARRAQNDLGSFVEEWKNLEERKAWLEMEILQKQQAIDEQRILSNQMCLVASTVKGLTQPVMDGQWDPVIKILREVDDLRVTGNDELSSIAIAAIHPFFRQSIEGWQPLEDPKLTGVASDGFAPALDSIRELLGIRSTKTNGSSLTPRDPSVVNGSHNLRGHKTTPYESLMYTIWFPKVRSAITNSWDVHDPAPLQALLEIWEGLLPDSIRSQILNQLIVRKLDDAVAEWNPKRKRHVSLPHLWLFPWLQYLEAHHSDPKSSTGLVSDVKRKFRQLIDAWDFRRGVVPGLEQWRSVLRAGYSDHWTPLIVNHVLPNLARFLRMNFQVAPQDQEPFMPYLRGALEWLDILGPKMMGELMVEEMFPIWHDVLHQWLTLDGVNYLEIRDWLAFWQSIIPDDINAVPAVKAEWKRGDDLINQALDLGLRAKTELPAPTRRRVSKETPKTATPTMAVPEVDEVRFRRQVEDWCMSHELQFIPEKGTLEANGPVYRVTAAPIGKGGVLIYLRGDDIYAQIKRGVWSYLGKEMDALFELAHR